MQNEIIITIIITLVVAGSLAAMMTRSTGGTGGFQNWVCAYTPFCKGDIESQNEMIANESSEVLWCAINSVAAGMEDNSARCSKYLEGKALPMGTRDEKGEVIRASEATFKCEKTGADIECKVTAFELPQKIVELNKLLPGYGDPRFLVYYEDFPEGEDDTWTTWAAVNLLLTVVPVGKIPLIGKFLMKPLAWATKPLKLAVKGVGKFARFTKGMGEKLFVKIAKTGIKESEEKIAKEILEQGIFKGAKTVLTPDKKYVYKIVGEISGLDGKVVDTAVGEALKAERMSAGQKIYTWSLKAMAKIARNEKLYKIDKVSTRMFIAAAEKNKLIQKEAADLLLQKAKNKGMWLFLSDAEEQALRKGIVDQGLEKTLKASKELTDTELDQIFKCFEDSLRKTQMDQITAEALEKMQETLNPTLRDKIFILTPKYILIDETVGEGEQTIDDLMGQKYLEVNKGLNTLLFKDAKKKEASKMEFTDPAALGSGHLKYVELDRAGTNPSFYLASPCKTDLEVKRDICDNTKWYDKMLDWIPGVEKEREITECIKVDPHNMGGYDNEMDANFCYSVWLTKDFGISPWPCHGIVYLDRIPWLNTLLQKTGFAHACR